MEQANAIDNNRPETLKELSSTSGTSYSSKRLSLVILFLLIMLFVSVYFVMSSKSKSQNQSTPLISKVSPTGYPAIMKDFFLTSVPKPIKNITLADLPNYKSVYAVPYKDHLMLGGSGTIIEYDPNLKEIVRYSNPRKAFCNGNIVLVKNFLFSACRNEGADFLYKPNFDYPPYVVYKINLLDYSVDHIFSKSDGLLSEDNYFLIQDGDVIWLGTFDGLGRINVETNEVKFFRDELAIQATQFEIGDILVDDEHVWVYVQAHKFSKGGLALYDKNTLSWKSFGPNKLKTAGFDRFDPYANGIKLVPGGIEIVIYEYSSETKTSSCIYRRYEYSTREWETVDIQPFEGCGDRVKASFPQDHSLLTTNQIKGKANLYISPLIGEKRYILTDTTVDILDDTMDLPQTLISLDSDIEQGSPHTVNQGQGALLIDPDSLLSVVIYSGCGPADYCNNAKIWLLDLKSARTLRTYNPKLPLEDSFSLDQWKLIKEQDALVVSSKDGKPLFTIDTTNRNFNLLK